MVTVAVNKKDFQEQMEVHLREIVRKTGPQLHEIHRHAISVFGINGLFMYIDEYQGIILKWLHEDAYIVSPGLIVPWSIKQIKSAIEM